METGLDRVGALERLGEGGGIPHVPRDAAQARARLDLAPAQHRDGVPVGERAGDDLAADLSFSDDEVVHGILQV